MWFYVLRWWYLQLFHKKDDDVDYVVCVCGFTQMCIKSTIKLFRVNSK